MKPQDELSREMDRRTAKSIFTSGGDLKFDTARSLAKDGQVYLGEYLHLAGVPWAPDPYGSEHCILLGRLVEYMATLTPKWGCIEGGPLDEREAKILHAVAMLYCTGLGFEGKPIDTQGYEERSAKNAGKFLSEGGAKGTFWDASDVREEVCRLIYKHNDPSEIASDKRLKVFQDAVRYENVRFSPNTAEGIALLKERCKPELFYSGWAKDKGNFRAWMLYRGWK